MHLLNHEKIFITFAKIVNGDVSVVVVGDLHGVCDIAGTFHLVFLFLCAYF